MPKTDIGTKDMTGTGHDFRSDVERLGRHVGQLQDDLGGIAKGAREAAESGLAAAKEGGRNTFEAAKEKGELATASLRGRIANHPGAAVGIAVGVGILIGLLGPAIVRSGRRASED
jgi:ElaB/YqjD/DUF883 family membrane-anchored ribosome-binding protein